MRKYAFAIIIVLGGFAVTHQANAVVCANGVYRGLYWTQWEYGCSQTPLPQRNRQLRKWPLQSRLCWP